MICTVSTVDTEQTYYIYRATGQTTTISTNTRKDNYTLEKIRVIVTVELAFI